METFRCRVNGAWYTVDIIWETRAVMQVRPLPEGQAGYYESRAARKQLPADSNIVADYRHGMRFDPLESIGITAAQIMAKLA